MNRAAADVLAHWLPDHHESLVALPRCLPLALAQLAIFPEDWSQLLCNWPLPYTSRAPENATTTSPTWLPILAWQVHRQSKNRTAVLEWLAEQWPALLAEQIHYHDQRDQQGEGLLALWHPQEALLPADPVWQTATPSPTWQLAEPAWHALWCWNNECLIELGQLLKTDVSAVVSHQELTIHSLNEKLWDEEYGIYRVFDGGAQEGILNGSLGGLLPLAGGIPTQEQAEMITQALEANFVAEQTWWTPSYSLNSPQFASEKPHQGAIDPFANWLLYRGLLRYDFLELAELVRKNTCHLIREYGFYAYYDAQRKELGNAGIGSGNYGPTAGVYLEMATKRKPRRREAALG